MSLEWQEFLSRQFLNNSYERWGTALVILFAGFLTAALLRRIVLHRLRKIAVASVTRIDDLFVLLIERTTLPFIFSVFLYFALRSLRLPEGVVSALNHLIVFGAFVQVGFWAGAGLSFYSIPYTTISEKN